MKDIHTPTIGASYWVAITLASIFGTNLGDLYAHDSGFGIIGGLPILALLFAAVFVVEKFDSMRHLAYYWLAIIIIRTAATNIGDILAGRSLMHIDRTILSVALAAALAALAWVGRPKTRAPGPSVAARAETGARPPATNMLYWLTMLVAGTFGTVFGDLCAHAVGGGAATIGCGIVLAGVLYAGRRGLLVTFGYYWFALAIVRTFGTVAGDWLAENPQLHIGLLVSTVATGVVFALAVLLWRDAQLPRTAS